MCVVGCGDERVLCEDGADADAFGFGGDVAELAFVKVTRETDFFTAEEAEVSPNQAEEE